MTTRKKKESSRVTLGPFYFAVTMAPSVVLDESKPATVRVRSAATEYEVASKSNKKPQVPSALTEGDLYYDAQLCAWVLPGVTFTNSSNGSLFHLEFNFTFHVVGSKNHSCVVNSMPFAILSNVSQWETGEAAYIAYLAFGEKSGPKPYTTFASLYNAMNVSQYTFTRQLAAQFYRTKLRQAYEEGVAHFSSAKTREGSDRSKTHRTNMDLYESFEQYLRVKRFLTEDEMRALFQTKWIDAQQVDLHSPSSPYASMATSSEGKIEVVEYDEFLRGWRWWEPLAYKMYTGQTTGTENRWFYLDGLLHIVKDDAPRTRIRLDPEAHPIGTAIMRTSSQPGTITYDVIVEQNGKPTVVSIRPDVTGGKYAYALHYEPGIQRLVNTHGDLVHKHAIVKKYKKTTEEPKKAGYVDSLCPT